MVVGGTVARVPTLPWGMVVEGCRTVDLSPQDPSGTSHARWVTGTPGGGDMMHPKLWVFQRRLRKRPSLLLSGAAAVAGLLSGQGGGAQHAGSRRPCPIEPAQLLASLHRSALRQPDCALSPIPRTPRLSGAPSGHAQHSRAG